MEDAGQDTLSSPATPGSGKSKLDSLSKEDLIKFAKKQIFILQKVKSRCTELEKEVEELKSKPSSGGNEDLIQALTDRLDTVLLEKAEAQQQLVSLKKENGKIKQDARDAAEKTDKLQEQWDQLSTEHLKQIEYLKNELETFNFNHNEEMCRMEHKLQESVDQQTTLTNKLSLQNVREDEIKRLQVELQLLRPTYEDQIFQLKKELELLMEEKNLQNIKLQEVEKIEFKNHLSEVGHLKKELLKFKTVHQEVVSELEAYNKEHTEDIKMVKQLMQDIAEQYLEKEKSLQKELQETKIKYEQELLLFRGASDETKEHPSTSTEGPNLSSSELEEQGKVKHLENILKEYDSQQSILRDELVYTKNVKLKLEVEVQHLKDEFFHEREELEFKINELQLAKEECTCAIEKLQFQLQNKNEQFEIVTNHHSHEVLTLKEQHKKDILDLRETLCSSSEQDKDSFVFEVQVLKEQCERLKQEKEEAISNYETLRETLVTLQDELGESAIKISQEFNAMKQQQATDVQELQQKLRTAYNEKDTLLETVNRLNSEVEQLSCKQSDYEELQQKVCNIQSRNEELVFSLQQKDASLKELEEKVVSLGFQNSNTLSTLECCRKDLDKLQELYEKEKSNVLELNHKIEVLSKDNHQLKQQYMECIKTLTDGETEKDKCYQKFSEFEKQIECFKHEKEALLSEAKVHNDEIFKLNEVKHAITKEMEQIMSASESGSAMKEQIENLQNKLQLANVKNEELSKSYEKEQQQKLHNEERLSSEVQALCNEVGKLLEEKERMSRAIEKYMEERNASLAIQDQVQNLQNKLQLVNEEKEEFGKLFEKAQQQNLILEESLYSELQALRGEILKLHEEKEKLTGDIESSIVDRNDSSAIKEQFQNLQNKLELVIVEKEELSKFHDEEMQNKLLNEGRLSSEVQALDIEVQRLLKDKEEMTRSIEKLMAEQAYFCAIKEQVEILQNKLQLETEEKEELSKLFEKNEQQKLLLESHLGDFLLQMGHLPLDNGNQENSIHTVLQAMGESVTRLKEQNQNLVFQSNEKCLLLQQNVDKLQHENESQITELQSIIKDFGKENLHLQDELAATLSENKVLQRDLLEMRNACETTKLDNLDLLARIENLSKKFENGGSEPKEQAEQLPEMVQENLEGLLEQKDSDLCNLKAEFMFLKDTMDKSMAVESDQQAAITELQMIIVNLEKVGKEKEEKSNKFKAVAVKAKKELDSTRKELQTLKEQLELVRSEKNQLSSSVKDLIQGAESYKNLLVEYDKQAEQLDLAKEQANYCERQIEDIKRQLQAAYHQLDMGNSEKEDLLVRVETLQSNTRLLESEILDMQRAKTSIDKELEAEKLLKEQKIKNNLGVLKQLEEVQTQLQKERKQLQDTMHELELVRKDAQKSTLMDMEMADYDRLVKELNHDISDKNSRLEDLEEEIALQKQKEETLQEEITSLQASVEQYEERSMKMKQLLVKTKKDLADSKQAETDHHLLQASLKGELEASQQQGESFKIQVAELTAEKHRLQEQLRASMEQQQRATSTYQQKIASLQDAYSIAKADQAAVTTEFEGYKVRVHNVLKQQKNKSSNQIEHDLTRQEREHMEIMLEQLKNKLHDTQHNLHINSSELQTLQADHDTLLDRHNKMLQETVAKEAELREKLCTVQSENMVMKSEHAQVLSQLTAQNEALRNSFRDQVRHMQEDHRKTMETLQQQLSRLEAQLFQQRSESSITSPTSSQPPTKTLRDRRAADVPLLDMFITAREEGEGMETTDTDSVSSTSTYLPPLDQLLNSPETKFEPAECQPEPSKEELAQKLNTMAKSIDHLSELLHETEATNAVLMEQITLLKSEIRRLERNQEREKSVNNLEYLKNVLLQFIFLKAGSERQRLLPVIDTMLHLSPDEKGKLVAIALGEEEAAARPAGWASYLHSWSGLR